MRYQDTKIRTNVTFRQVILFHKLFNTERWKRSVFGLYFAYKNGSDFVLKCKKSPQSSQKTCNFNFGVFLYVFRGFWTYSEYIQELSYGLGVVVEKQQSQNDNFG